MFAIHAASFSLPGLLIYPFLKEVCWDDNAVSDIDGRETFLRYKPVRAVSSNAQNTLDVCDCIKIHFKASFP